MIEFDAEVCGDLGHALSREWVEANGIGGYASSTIPGLNTRRYHGLLVASLRPPVERFVLLSKLEETLVVDGVRTDLGTNQYSGVVQPDGYRLLTGFRLDPFPVWTYRVGEIELERRLFLVHGENTVVVRYSLRSAPRGAKVEIEVRPLIAFRDYHALTHENAGLNHGLELGPRSVSVRPYQGLPPLHFAHSAADVEEQGYWYRHFQYAAEIERGMEGEEDLFNPLVIRLALRKGKDASVIASTEIRDAADAARLEKSERARRASVITASPAGPPIVPDLFAAADQFVARRGDGDTLLAGYHWFTDWGRDTMISLPGIALVTGRFDVARSILREFVGSLHRGLLPNRFFDSGEAAEYNTVDATLWLFEAVRSFGEYTGDYDFIREQLYPALVGVIDWHVRGTLHGIRMDSDGLLRSGEPGVQLTWMDARVGDWVVTPRTGKPVEIQALWHNALRVMQDLAGRFGDEGSAKEYGRAAGRASRSFNEQFWNLETECLFDVVDGDERDASLRPNQILAVSLHHSMLSRARGKQVVVAVDAHLRTPYGLRTLSPDDPRYEGVYEGDGRTRDARYHQGTVWPWLMGPFITAYVRVNGGTARSRAEAGDWLEPFHKHLRDACLGQVSEILDGDAPHRPRGCVAQAWSTAELLRAIMEDILGLRPGESR